MSTECLGWVQEVVFGKKNDCLIYWMIKVKRKDIHQIKLGKKPNETLYLRIEEDLEMEQGDGMLIVTKLKLDYWHYYFGLEQKKKYSACLEVMCKV